MVRPLRLLVDDGSYHVTTKGIASQRIYASEHDRTDFLELLDQITTRFGWRCLSYCLMDNHFHVLVQTPQPNLSRGVQQLKARYAQAFNARYGRAGPLFAGRFKARLIQKDAHLLEVFRYIALNPVRAGLCADPSAWAWSAHAALAGRREPARFLAVEEARNWFSTPQDLDGREAYRVFVEGDEQLRLSDEEAVAVGDAQFVRSVLPATSPGTEFRKRDWGPGRPPLSELLRDEDLGACIANAYLVHGYTLSSIAAALGCHVSTVSRRLRAHEQAMLDCKI
jgi:putative transposase